MTQRIKNKVALITGAASGIGATTAELFAQQGATVIVTDINDVDGKKVAEKIGPSAVFYHLDVSQEQQWQTVIDQVITKFQQLNIVINNAGILGHGNHFGEQDPEHCSLDDWQKINSINSEGTFLGCKHAIRVMKNFKNCSIVNVGSRSGLVGIPSSAAYAASKAAIRNHTKTVALYCAQNNYSIRCNCVHPAAILTPIWDPMLSINTERNEQINKIASEIPLQHMGAPIDVAYAILYLASDESAFVTGTELIIDGGILAGSAAAPKKH